MSNSSIESLSKTGTIQERLSPLQMWSLKRSVRNLVKVTHQRLVENQEKILYDLDPVFCAYFSVPEINGVMSITSIRSPDLYENRGLYLEIDCRNEKEGEKQPVGIRVQTAKIPKAVGKQEALRLSDYTPKQLLLIAKMVKTAIPITEKRYQSYFQTPNKIPAGSEM